MATTTMRSLLRHRRRKPSQPTQYHRRRLLLISLSLFILFFFSVHIVGAVLRRANSLGRRCFSVSGENLGFSQPSRLRIGMVSLSDDSESSRRSFKGVMAEVEKNKLAYAERMGYDFIDGRDLIDRTRPPNWSKIVAVLAVLQQYHWVFWNDADTVVTNHDISLESILWSAIGHLKFDSAPDFVVTEDFNGVNSGVFFVRRSKWSKTFLNKWWNLTSFIRFGSTKSGDNAALMYLIHNLSAEELRDHVRISPMQCLFNSYPWSLSWKSIYRLVSSPRAIWRGSYSRGDFMIHFAGLNEKKKLVAEVLQEIQTEK